MKMLTSFVITGIVVLAGIFAVVRWLEAKAVFYPMNTTTLTPAAFQLAWDDVWVTTSDGVRIHGWWIKQGRASTVVLFSHGNAGNINDRLTKIKFFHDLGFDVVIYDYRGFGQSEGHPTENGVYLDAQAMFDWIAQHPVLGQMKILAYGASLGGVVAIDLATHRPLTALVVDSSFTSAKDMAHRLYPMLPTWMMSIKFDAISKIKSLTMPKLFVHSPEDRVIPFAMGQALFKAAPEPKMFLEVKGGHNDVQLATNPDTVKAFKHFLNMYQVQ